MTWRVVELAGKPAGYADHNELELLAGPGTPMKITKIDGEFVYAEMV